MKIQVEYCKDRPPTFQVWRVGWANLTPGTLQSQDWTKQSSYPAAMFMLTIDFSNRVEPAGVYFDVLTNGEGSMRLCFRLQDGGSDCVFIHLIPENDNEKDLIEYGQMNKRTYAAVLIPRSAHFGIKSERKYMEKEVTNNK